MLLESDHREARVIGLKLLNRCSSSASMVAPWIIRALGAKDDYEIYGGLHELYELLRRPIRPQRSDVVGVRDALERISNSADPNLRESASRCSDWISTIEEQ
jgi:hypothetical protein